MRHQDAAVTPALHIGAHRDRADHDQRCCRAIGGAVRDGPALDGADQHAILDQRKAERRHRIDAFADAIGGSSKAIRSESGVEQKLDRLRLNIRQWK